MEIRAAAWLENSTSWILLALLWCGTSFGSSPSPGPSPSSQAEFMHIGYYTNWAQYRTTGENFRYTPSQLNPSLYTHIVWSFAWLTCTLKVDSTCEEDSFVPRAVEYNDFGYYKVFNQVIRARNPDCKKILAFGGWSYWQSTLFSELCQTQRGRNQTIVSMMQYTRHHGFDGIDLDWEYPAFADMGGRPEDKENFRLFLQEFRNAVESEVLMEGQEKLTLSVAVSANPAIAEAAYADTLHEYVDWIGIMAYDMYYGYDETSAHTALRNGRLSCAMAVEWWLQRAPATKLVLGLAAYGRSFSLDAVTIAGRGARATGPGYGGPIMGASGVLAYYEILMVQQDPRSHVEYDEYTQTMWMQKNNQWVTYDSPETMGMKVDLALADYNLLGTMMWSVDFDDFGRGAPLTRVVIDRSCELRPGGRFCTINWGNKVADLEYNDKDITQSVMPQVRFQAPKHLPTEQISSYRVRWSDHNGHTQAGLEDIAVVMAPIDTATLTICSGPTQYFEGVSLRYLFPGSMDHIVVDVIGTDSHIKSNTLTALEDWSVPRQAAHGLSFTPSADSTLPTNVNLGGSWKQIGFDGSLTFEAAENPLLESSYLHSYTVYAAVGVRRCDRRELIGVVTELPIAAKEDHTAFKAQSLVGTHIHVASTNHNGDGAFATIQVVDYPLPQQSHGCGTLREQGEFGQFSNTIEEVPVCSHSNVTIAYSDGLTLLPPLSASISVSASVTPSRTPTARTQSRTASTTPSPTPSFTERPSLVSQPPELSGLLITRVAAYGADGSPLGLALNSNTLAPVEGFEGQNTSVSILVPARLFGQVVYIDVTCGPATCLVGKIEAATVWGVNSAVVHILGEDTIDVAVMHPSKPGVQTIYTFEAVRVYFCDGYFPNREPVYHFTANCSGITAHGDQCTLAVSEHYRGGSVTCNQTFGQYEVIAATELMVAVLEETLCTHRVTTAEECAAAADQLDWKQYGGTRGTVTQEHPDVPAETTGFPSVTDSQQVYVVTSALTSLTPPGCFISDSLLMSQTMLVYFNPENSTAPCFSRFASRCVCKEPASQYFTSSASPQLDANWTTSTWHQSSAYVLAADSCTDSIESAVECDSALAALGVLLTAPTPRNISLSSSTAPSGCFVNRESVHYFNSNTSSAAACISGISARCICRRATSSPSVTISLSQSASFSSSTTNSPTTSESMTTSTTSTVTASLSGSPTYSITASNSPSPTVSLSAWPSRSSSVSSREQEPVGVDWLTMSTYAMGAVCGLVSVLSCRVVLRRRHRQRQTSIQKPVQNGGPTVTPGLKNRSHVYLSDLIGSESGHLGMAGQQDSTRTLELANMETWLSSKKSDDSFPEAETSRNAPSYPSNYIAHDMHEVSPSNLITQPAHQFVQPAGLYTLQPRESTWMHDQDPSFARYPAGPTFAHAREMLGTDHNRDSSSNTGATMPHYTETQSVPENGLYNGGRLNHQDSHHLSHHP